MKRKVEVSLLGQRFTVKSDRDEAYLHQVASFVNRKFEELRRHSRPSSSDQLGLLVAMNLADELFRSEERHAEVCGDLRRRTERALESVDAVLAEMSPGETDATGEVVVAKAEVLGSSA